MLVKSNGYRPTANHFNLVVGASSKKNKRDSMQVRDKSALVSLFLSKNVISFLSVRYKNVKKMVCGAICVGSAKLFSRQYRFLCNVVAS